MSVLSKVYKNPITRRVIELTAFLLVEISI